MNKTITISRDEWGALPPTESLPLELPALRMSFKFTGTNQCSTRDECTAVVRTLQKTYMNRGYPDLPYNFLIGGDRRVYEGRGWNFKVYDEKIIVGYLGKENDDDYIYLEKVQETGLLLMNDASELKYIMPIIHKEEDHTPENS